MSLNTGPAEGKGTAKWARVERGVNSICLRSNQPAPGPVQGDWEQEAALEIYPPNNHCIAAMLRNAQEDTLRSKSVRSASSDSPREPAWPGGKALGW